jgi:hypothetical protein
VEGSCELSNEPSGSIKMLGIYQVAAQLAASGVVLSFTELVMLESAVCLVYNYYSCCRNVISDTEIARCDKQFIWDK